MDNVVKALRILKKYINVFEESDPQFKAIKRVAEVHGPKALGVVVGNALVSYRLKGTGEEYWQEFGEFFSAREPTVENLIEFIKLSKYNVALKEQKVSRIKRARRFLERLSERPEEFRDLELLRLSAAKALNAKGTEKTLTFAAKMAYYLFKALGAETSGDVPVPVDSRVATVTCSSGLVEGDVEQIMGPKRDEAVRAWSEAAELAGVRTLHLDALIWLPSRGLRRALCRGVERGRSTLSENLKSLGVEEHELVASLLVRKRCC